MGRIDFLEVQQPVHPALQQIYGLDRTSPEFDNQLDDLLHGDEYEGCVQELENSDLVWLINYLDNVRLYVPFSASRSTQHRHSMVLIPPVPLPGSVYAN